MSIVSDLVPLVCESYCYKLLLIFGSVKSSLANVL